MPRAWCLLREAPAYRREAFAAGLAAAGFAVTVEDYHRASIPSAKVTRDDLLVCWNRYSVVEQIANSFEAAGGRVIIAENGYLGSDANGIQHYALALGGHNGSGRWPAGSAERWARLGIELQPWRERGEHILVAPNRSFGPKGFAMPQGWADSAVRRLREITKREVRLRPHPGNWQVAPPKVPLAEDLNGCWCVVIWASSAGVHALIQGVPVICEAPAWIAYGAAGHDVRRIETPEMPDRLPAFHRLASAQWTIADIASGEPFRQLLAL